MLHFSSFISKSQHRPVVFISPLMKTFSSCWTSWTSRCKAPSLQPLVIRPIFSFHLCSARCLLRAGNHKGHTVDHCWHKGYSYHRWRGPQSIGTQRLLMSALHQMPRCHRTSPHSSLLLLVSDKTRIGKRHFPWLFHLKELCWEHRTIRLYWSYSCQWSSMTWLPWESHMWVAQLYAMVASGYLIRVYQQSLTWKTVSSDCQKESKLLLGLSCVGSKLKRPPKTCMPSKAKMTMKRKSRSSKLAIERILLSNEATRLRSDDQYLHQQNQGSRLEGIHADAYGTVKGYTHTYS